MSKYFSYFVVPTIFLTLGCQTTASNQVVIVNETKLDTCALQNITIFENGQSTNGQIIGFCKEECFTNPVLSEILCSKMNKTTECTFFNGVGVEIETCSDLFIDEEKEVNIQNLYVVDEARMFVFPAFEIGHQAVLEHISTPFVQGQNDDSSQNKAIVIETLSVSPRVFRLYNFFSAEEASDLIKTALAQTEATHVLKRSSVGSEGYTQSSQRTSENAFDTGSKTAMDIKHRGFDLLGIRPYDETFADGLQVLRYNQTAAYIPHLDWLDPGDPEHDYESDGVGTNRFATIFLYLTDVEEGGETVFIHAKADANNSNTETLSKTADEIEAEVDGYLTHHNASHLFTRHSWERNMVTQCRTKLAIKPRRADAILFYSQLPDGRADEKSTHGGCPVITGEKWAANLWVWNGPRKGYTQRNTHTRLMELSDSGKELSSWGWFLPHPNLTSTGNNVSGSSGMSSSNSKRRDRKAKVTTHDLDSSSVLTDGDGSTPPAGSILVTFQSLDEESASLHWQETNDFYGELSRHQPPILMNSYPGHSWTVKRGETVVAVWVVRELESASESALASAETGKRQPTQVFTLNTSYNDNGGGDASSATDGEL